MPHKPRKAVSPAVRVRVEAKEAGRFTKEMVMNVPPALPRRAGSHPATVHRYVDDRPDEGIFQVHRDAFVDPDLFELELAYVFGRTWNFLGFESQIPKPHDFITTYIARTPVLVTRGSDGQVRALFNVCRHKGAKLCGIEQGNAQVHVCPYHAWSYDSTGANVAIKDRVEGDYAASFVTDDHNLKPLGQVASYKGLIFGSISPDVPALEEFLGDTRFFIDLVMDQGPHGMEPIPGRALYSFRGNWKLQLENGMDTYHLTTTHRSFLNIQSDRWFGKGNQDIRKSNVAGNMSLKASTFTLPYGHGVLTLENTDPTIRPIYSESDQLRSRVGETKTKWTMERSFNAAVFPNLNFTQNYALILRVARPVSVDETEMTTYCLGAIGETKAQRALRLREFEDFFNASGLATPDDSLMYERVQDGLTASGPPWLQGYARGMRDLKPGGNDWTKEISVRPIENWTGILKAGPEVVLHEPYREWSRLIDAGLRGERAYG
jgi:phenylpropionate dioxygenase-like ring-hydroxylating dioxygenase large terminal subunit